MTTPWVKFKNFFGYKESNVILECVRRSSKLLDMINIYQGNYIYDNTFSGASYIPKSDISNETIKFGAGYKTITSAIHELVHATGKYQAFANSYDSAEKNYDTATAYAQAMLIGEGEAYYWERKIILELNSIADAMIAELNGSVGDQLTDEERFDRLVALNNLKADLNSELKETDLIVWENGKLSAEKSVARWNEFKALIDSVDSTASDEAHLSVFKDIAKIVQVMVGSGRELDNVSAPHFTYDERFKINHLIENTDIVQDFQEIAVRNESIFNKPFLVKTLTNEQNNADDARFLGDQDTNDLKDTLTNTHAGGTALAQHSGQGDLLYGGKGEDTLYGNSGKDILLGGGGSDHLYGKEGEDVLGGNADDDHLYGGKGSDQLHGGTGFDTYTIEDADIIFDTDGQGKLLFDTEVPQYFITATPGVTDSWVSSNASGEQDGKFTAIRQGDDLLVTLNADRNNSATIKGYFLNKDTLDGTLMLHLVESKHGTAKEYTLTPYDNVHNEYYLGPHSYAVNGSPYHELIFANNARPGKSKLGLLTNTGAGNDIVFGSFYNDVIEGGADTDILFGSANPEERTDEQKRLDNDTIAGNEGTDYIFGKAGNDVLHGGNAGEYLLKESVDEQGDWINGGDGDDHIHGSRAHDVLQGGAGIDHIYGGAGNDLLVGDADHEVRAHINRTTGNYRPLTHRHTYNAQIDDFNPIERLGIHYKLNENSARWTLNINSDTHNYEITRNYHDWDGKPLAADANGATDYLDGGAGNDLLLGQLGNDHLRGGLGSDILKGGEGADSYYFYQEDLQDNSVDILIDDGQGDGTNRDVIALDSYTLQQFSWGYDPEQKIYLNALGWTMRKEGNELLIGHKDKPNLIRVKDHADGDFGIAFDETPQDPKPEDPNPEDPQNPQPPVSGAPLAPQSIDEKQALSFTVPESAFQSGKDDPLSYSAQLADGKPLPAWLAFDSASRTFSGTPGNDDVGTLNIELSAKGKGGTASQRFTLNILNVNDAPQAGEALADVQAERGKPLTYVLPANAFTDIDKDDTLTLSAALENGDALPAWLNFDAGNSRFAGTPPADAQAAYRIVLTATDKAGARIAQSFVLNIGNSQTNIIRDTGTGKILHGTAGNDTIYGNDHILPGGNYKEIHGLDGNDEIIPGKGRSMLYGNAGNDILRGGEGDDYLSGEDGDDILEGGAGNDLLSAGKGNDIYRFSGDFGRDTVRNLQGKDDGGGHDALEFTDLRLEDIIFEKDGFSTLVIRNRKNSASVSVNNYFLNDGKSPYHIDEIRLADGHTLDYAAVKAKAYQSTDGDDLVWGDDGDNTLHGGLGDDTLHGGDGNDQLQGDAGNDKLFGYSGNDRLIGGQGNDYMIGGAGNDTYHFARDFGRDFINNHDSSAGRHDRIAFSELNLADLDIRRESNNLILRDKNGNGQITVQNHFVNGWHIDDIRFADGTTLDYDTINRLVQGAGNTTRSAFRRVDSASVQQAQQMTQAMASFDGVQPLDALAVPEVRQLLLAVHNG